MFTSTITLYSPTWCGPCKGLKSDLEKSGIPFTQIDVKSDKKATAHMETINNGNRTVPTLVFSDGTSMTNPSIAKVKSHLGLAWPQLRQKK